MLALFCGAMFILFAGQIARFFTKVRTWNRINRKHDLVDVDPVLANEEQLFRWVAILCGIGLVLGTLIAR